MKKYKPSVEEIKSIVDKCEKRYYQIHQAFKQDETFYELNFHDRLNLPDEYARDAVVLPTGRDMVDAAVDHSDITNARVFVNRKGVTKSSDENAEMMRKFYLGLIYRTNIESPISPWRVAAKHFWLHGISYLKTLWDADRWPDKPIQKKGESDEAYKERIDEWQGHTELSVPIIIQAVNPKNVMADPFHIVPQFYIEKHERLAYNIKQRYPHWNLEVDGDKEVEWVEFWDGEYKCFLADGEPVLKVPVVPHKYGLLPYVPVESGLGNVSIDTDINMRYVGILRYMQDILIAESRGYSVSEIVLRQEAWPWFTIDGPNADKVGEIKRYFGEATPLPEGVRLTPQSPSVPPEALYRHFAISQDIINQHGATRSVRGLSETNVRSGADRRLLMSMGAAKFSYATEAFKQGTAKVLTNCAHLFKNVVPGDVRLWNWSQSPIDQFDAIIKKDKMREPFTCYVEFAPISEEDEYRRHDDLMRQLQSGILTKKAARRQLSNIDPLTLEEEEAEETIRMSPSLAQGRDKLIAERWAAAVAQRNAAEMIQAPQAPPQVPPQGMPQGMPPQVQPQRPPQAPPQGIPQGGQPNISGRMTPPITQAATPLDALKAGLKQQRSPVPLRPGQGQGGGGRRYA